jgi:hypothetical protein
MLAIIDTGIVMWSIKHRDETQLNESGPGQPAAQRRPDKLMSGQQAQGQAPGHFIAQPLDLLLTEGGDPRLAISMTDNMNSYGCRPAPRPEAITFASTTASSISEHAYLRASQARYDLMEATAKSPEEKVFDTCIEKMRRALKTCLTLENEKTEVIFTPSGTDGQLIALFVAREMLGPRVASIVVASNETGGGTVFTAKGQHFNTYTAQGVAVKKGESVTALVESVNNIDIPLRDEKGVPRSFEEMDGLVISAIETAISKGEKVLLQTMDSSKLGWRSPSQKCLNEISKRWPQDVLVVVDACQMRLGRGRIKEYLNCGYVILLTASKFFTAPPFCGALLVPAAISAQLAKISKVPAGLYDYSNRSDWPVEWPGIKAALPARLNFGQWLRWEAGIEEMRAYFKIPQRERQASLQSFEAVVTQCLANSHSLKLLAAQARDDGDTIDDEEMALRTIFPFTVSRDGELLSADDCKKLYLALNKDVSTLLPPSATSQEKQLATRPCHIGQPVALPEGAVLRISAGARTVTEGWKPDDVKTVIDKIELLLKYFAAIDVPEAAAEAAAQKPLRCAVYPNLQTRIGMAKLTKMAFDNIPLKPLWDQLYKEVEKNPLNAAAMMDLSDVAQISGLQANGLVIQSGALGIERLYRIPCATTMPHLRVLKLSAAIDMGANTPIDFLLEGSDVELTVLYIVPGTPLPDPLPQHDVAFVAVPDSEAGRPVLAAIDRLVPHWPRPILNLPSRVHHLNRDELYALLKPVSCLYIPMTARLSRAHLTDIGAGKIPLEGILADGAYPLIVRPIDSHAGRGLDKLEKPDDIGGYLAEHPEDFFFISRYIDYSGTDGQFRKYRIVFIDGKPYACHMAISEQWKIWYLNANMAASAAKRKEEESFMLDFDNTFGARHSEALADIGKKINLEYFAIDCAETKTGELLIFEAGNTMIIHDMDPPGVYPYKHPQMMRVFQAFIQMIARHAGIGQNKIGGG